MAERCLENAATRADWRERHVDCAPHFLRRDRQVRTISAPRLVAGCDGRPNAGERLIHAATMVAAGVFLVARVYPIFSLGGTNQRSQCTAHRDAVAHGRGLGRRHHRVDGGADCRRADGHQTNPRLLHRLAAWPHDGFVRRRRGRGRDHPPPRARFFQGAALPRLGFGHSRLSWRTGHPEDGRPSKIHAGHVCHLCDRNDGVERCAALFSGAWTKEGCSMRSDIGRPRPCHIT